MAVINLTALSAHQTEGNGGGAKPFTFTIRRVGDVSGAADVGWQVAGQAGAGTFEVVAADFDGGAFPSGTASFAAGVDEVIVTVLVAGDSAVEVNERFNVTLSGPTGGDTIGTGTAHGIIRSDDGSRYSVGTSTFLQAEGPGGTTTYSFVVSRAGVSAGTDTIDWAVSAGGMAGTMAVNGADFVGGVLPSGTVSFAPGQSTRTIAIEVAGDQVRELNESFTVTLSNPSANAAIGRASATVGIVDDDTIEVSGSGDIVAGTAGADYFVISAGDHTVSGLGGTDRFVFAAPGGTTVLADFDFAAGERIDLRPIDAIAGTLANDAFTFVGAAGFTPAAGELLGIQIDPGVQLVAGDTDGDGTADFNIIIVSNDPAQANWFLL